MTQEGCVEEVAFGEFGYQEERESGPHLKQTRRHIQEEQLYPCAQTKPDINARILLFRSSPVAM